MTRTVSLMLLAVMALFGARHADAQVPSSELVDSWRSGGKYFAWTSTLPENRGRSAQVFYTCIGDAAKPTILMVHGFPTSSIDFRLLARELQADFRTCTLDFVRPPISTNRTAAVAR